MVKYSSNSLDSTFGALANPTRRRILEQLGQGELSVTDLAKPFDISLPGVSKHLRVLEDAGLITRHKVGRERRCRLATEPLHDAATWLAHYLEFWDEQLDALAAYLEEPEEGDKQNG
jgi:DNA-binding transcriptional ArsR family regulator